MARCGPGRAVAPESQPPAPAPSANGRHAAAREQQARRRLVRLVLARRALVAGVAGPVPAGRAGPAAGASEDGPDRPGRGAIPLPEDTSQVVSRLAQLLRENPTLAANWSREAQE